MPAAGVGGGGGDEVIDEEEGGAAGGLAVAGLYRRIRRSVEPVRICPH